jgi:hypothetical protein
LLKSEFESERLNEVDGLLAEGRDETIQYSGIFMQVNGVMYVSGVKVLIPANLQVPADGAAVVITGRTNAQRFVEIESIELLPEGAVVPVGEPVEVDDNESNSNSGSSSEEGANSNSNLGSGSEDGTGSGSGNEVPRSDSTETPKSDPQSFEMKGTVESISESTLVINGQTVYLKNTKIDGVLTPGANVEIKGYYATDGRFIVTEVKVKDSGSGSGGSNENSGSDSGSKPDSNSNDHSGSDSKDGGSNSNDDNSGSGGSGSGDGGGGGDG